MWCIQNNEPKGATTLGKKLGKNYEQSHKIG